MFVTRLFSSITLMVVTIVTLVMGGPLLLGALLIISLIGLYELYRVLRIQTSVLGFVGYGTAALLYLMMYLERTDLLLFVLVVSFIVIMATYVFRYPKYDSRQISMVFFGVFYVAVLLSYIYRIRCLEGGAYTVWLVYIGAWGSDTCAYLAGIWMGKRHLPSELSPKKTLEGCLGGIIGAALIGFIFAGVFRNQLAPYHHNPQATFPLLGSLAAILSQIGDLAASAIKRNHKVKDYGAIIPGHGGVLDRFDSVVLVAPIVYYFVTLL